MMIIHYALDFCIYRGEVKICIFAVPAAKQTLGFAGRCPAFGRGSPEADALSVAYDLRSFRRNKLPLRTKSFIEQKRKPATAFWLQVLQLIYIG